MDCTSKMYRLKYSLTMKTIVGTSNYTRSTDETAANVYDQVTIKVGRDLSTMKEYQVKK